MSTYTSAHLDSVWPLGGASHLSIFEPRLIICVTSKNKERWREKKEKKSPQPEEARAAAGLVQKAIKVERGSSAFRRSFFPNFSLSAFLGNENRCRSRLSKFSGGKRKKSGNVYFLLLLLRRRLLPLLLLSSASSLPKYYYYYYFSELSRAPISNNRLSPAYYCKHEAEVAISNRDALALRRPLIGPPLSHYYGLVRP